jgi:hypothetical protein
VSNTALIQDCAHIRSRPNRTPVAMLSHATQDTPSHSIHSVDIPSPPPSPSHSDHTEAPISPPVQPQRPHRRQRGTHTPPFTLAVRTKHCIHVPAQMPVALRPIACPLRVSVSMHSVTGARLYRRGKRGYSFHWGTSSAVVVALMRVFSLWYGREAHSAHAVGQGW